MKRAPDGQQEENLSYFMLLSLLHPRGLMCPRCGSSCIVRTPGGSRPEVPAHRCVICNSTFNAWTGTVLHGASCPPSEILSELMNALEVVSRRGCGPEASAGDVPVTNQEFNRHDDPSAWPGAVSPGS